MTFFENLSGFLFRPHRQCRNLLSEEELSKKLKTTFLFVLYGAVILSTIFVFWILYPERLYYPVPLIEFRQLPFITLSTPLILFMVFLVGLFLIIGVQYLAIGLGNYLLGNFLSRYKQSKKGYKKYLIVHGYSILPLLLLGIFTIFWIYFFEKLYLATEIPPFLDFTPAVIIFFVIFFLFLGWQWFVEMRINQAFFEISIIRAIIPELIQIAMFFGFIMLLQYLIGTFAAGTSWV